MFGKSKNAAPHLTEELVARVWDCTSRLKQLEDRFEGQLDELAKRYRRAEQSEKRYEDKKLSPCEEEAAATNGAPSRVQIAIDALKGRQGKLAKSAGAINES